MKRKNKSVGFIYTFTRLLSPPQRGAFREVLSDLYIYIERGGFFYVSFFFFCLHQSRVFKRAGSKSSSFFPSFVVLVNFTCVVLYACVIKEGREEKTRVVVVMWQLGAVSFFSTPPPSRMMMMMMMMMMGGVRALFLCLRKEEAQRCVLKYECFFDFVR